MFRITVFLLVHASLSLSFSTSWHHAALGRVLWATIVPSSTDALVTTQAGVVARLSLESGSLVWLSPMQMRILRVARSASFPTLAVLLESGHVRAISVVNGSVLWTRRGCDVSSNDVQFVVWPCTHDESNVLVHAWTGLAVTYNDENRTRESVGVLQAELETANGELAWRFAGTVLRSAPDGRLWVDGANGDVWAREEGLAHLFDGAFYEFSGESLFVGLSTLGLLYGLNTQRGGELLWKNHVGERLCALASGHRELAVVVCRHGEAGSFVKAVSVATGAGIFEKVLSGFQAEQATIDRRQKCGSVCAYVVLVDREGFERGIALPGCDVVPDGQVDRGWLSYGASDHKVHGLPTWSGKWGLSLPKQILVSTVAADTRPYTTGRHLHDPPVRVTMGRELWLKYDDVDVRLVLSEDKENMLVHAILLHARTGSVLDIATHYNAVGPVAAVKSSNWFVYSFWSTLLLHQEINVIDLYEPLNNMPAIRDMVLGMVCSAVGPLSVNTFCMGTGVCGELPTCMLSTSRWNGNELRRHRTESETPLRMPRIMKSSSLIGTRVDGLHASLTTRGFTEQSIIMRLDTGQIALVSKLFVDAGSPAHRNTVDEVERSFSYSPLLGLSSPSTRYMSGGKRVADLRQVSVAALDGCKSQNQVAAIGIDIVYSVENPVGALDMLPSDFVYSAVVGMLVALGGAAFNAHRETARLSLSRSW